MIDALQPGLEIREYKMNDGHELFGHFWIASLSYGCVEIVLRGQTSITAPVIGDDSCARCYSILDETTERVGAAVWNHCQTHAVDIALIFPLVEAAGGT